jgi:hypothetical protein
VPPRLSFVVPVRNDAVRLERCLKSIRASSSTIPSEVIVADNGSTDGSGDVARASGARVLELPNLRVSEVRNRAAAAAAGEFLAFVDADHEIGDGWTRVAMDVVDRPGTTAVGAHYHAPANGSWVQRAYDRLRNRRPGIHPVDWLPSGNLVIRRAAFGESGGFDTSLETCEDVDLCQRLRMNGHELLEVDAMQSVHHGDPRTLSAVFAGELWRGRDNLKVSLRVPLTLRSAPSVVAPVVTLAAIAAIAGGLIGWPWGGWRVAIAGGLWIVTLTGARTARLVARADKKDRTLVTIVQTWLVLVTYEVARALALVSRSGHAVRRRK